MISQYLCDVNDRRMMMKFFRDEMYCRDDIKTLVFQLDDVLNLGKTGTFGTIR